MPHFHLHYSDHVPWIHAAKPPRVSMSHDFQWLVILVRVCPQCHCKSVADFTGDVTIGQFASRHWEVFCQISAEIIGWILGNWMCFRWGLKWIIRTGGVMWGSWWQWEGRRLSQWGRVWSTLWDVQADRCAETSESSSIKRRTDTIWKRPAVNSGLTNGRITVCGTTVHTTAFHTSRQAHYQVCLQLW